MGKTVYHTSWETVFHQDLSKVLLILKALFTNVRQFKVGLNPFDSGQTMLHFMLQRGNYLQQLVFCKAQLNI